MHSSLSRQADPLRYSPPEKEDLAPPTSLSRKWVPLTSDFWAWLFMLSTILRFTRDLSPVHQNLPNQTLLRNSTMVRCMDLALKCTGWSPIFSSDPTLEQVTTFYVLLLHLQSEEHNGCDDYKKPRYLHGVRAQEV